MAKANDVALHLFNLASDVINAAEWNKELGVYLLQGEARDELADYLIDFELVPELAAVIGRTVD